MKTLGIRALACVLPALCLLSGTGLLAGEDEGAPSLRLAWQNWTHGRIEEARAAALANLEKDPADAQARHLHILTSFTLGRFEECLEQHALLDPEYGRYGELDSVFIDACNHLNRPAEAAAFARKRDQPENVRTWLEKRSRNPLKVELDGTSVVPFVEGSLPGDLIPAIALEINGKTVTANLDTGGAFLSMSPKMAAELGIETSPFGPGMANMMNVTLMRGLAKRVKLGDAVLSNVPATAIVFPEGANLPPVLENLLIVGTCVLEQFLTTWDNGRKRLVLSPRADEKARIKHFELIPEDRAAMEFYFLGDHHLGARGAVGDHDGLFFHVDTGLVMADALGRQPALATTAYTLKKWGIIWDGQGIPLAECPHPVSLGPLADSGHVIHVLRSKTLSWQGLDTDAVLAHGFTKNYAWTMDFDRRRWFFTKAE